MTKRGKVLRGSDRGQSLLISEGRQYQFALAGVWKSAIPPRPGQVVDVELDASGKIESIRLVPDWKLTSEQADVTRTSGTVRSAGIVARIGLANLIAAILLMLGWFFLTALSVQTPVGRLSFTFWEVLELLNSNSFLQTLMQNERGGSPGLYGACAVAATIGPLVPLLWRKKRAILLRSLPLLFMVCVGWMVWEKMAWENLSRDNKPANARLSSRESTVRESTVQDPLQLEAIHTARLGPGAYLALASSAYFALSMPWSLLIARPGERRGRPAKDQLAA